MGRKRITLKRIPNETSRKRTFMKRKEGIINKISQLCKMCGVEACLIVYDDGNGDVGPTIWPENLNVAHSILQKYERQKNERPLKTFDIQDYFENKKNMVEAEISKVHKQITSIKYPTWDPCFTNMEVEQLRAFITHVDAKIIDSDRKINILRNKHQSELAKFSFIQNMAQGSASSFNSSQIMHTPMEPLNGNNIWVDFTNSMNQVDGACNHGIYNMLRDMPQSDACFSFVPNMAQESANATSSHPSQLNCFQEISQSQLNGFQEISQSQLNCFQEISQSQLNCFQEISQSQLDCFQEISQSQLVDESSKALGDKNEMVDSSNQVDVPLDSTKELDGIMDSLDWLDQLDDIFEDWTDQPIDLSNQLVGGDLEDWDSQLIDWSNEPVLQNVPFQSQNEQQGVSALHAMPPPMDGFQ